MYCQRCNGIGGTWYVDVTSVSIAWSLCTINNNVGSCNAPTQVDATSVTELGGTNCIAYATYDALRPYAYINYVTPSTDFNTAADKSFFVTLNKLQCSLTVPVSANWLVKTGLLTASASDVNISKDTSTTFDIRLAEVATTTPSTYVCAHVTIEEIKHINDVTSVVQTLYTVAENQTQSVVTIQASADSAIKNLVLNPPACTVCGGFADQGQIYVKFKLRPGAWTTDTTTLPSDVPQYVEKYFQVGSLTCSIPASPNVNWLTITGQTTTSAPGDYLLRFDASKTYDIRLSNAGTGSDGSTCAQVTVEQIYYKDLATPANDRTIFDSATAALASQSVVSVSSSADSAIKTFVINPTACNGSICQSFAQPSLLRVVFKHTADAAVYTSPPSRSVTVDFNVLKITASAADTLDVVLNAVPDVPFSIDMLSKFSTNMDTNPNSPSYGKTELTYKMTCANPTVGSNPAAAAANNCCTQLFSLSGTTMTKSNVAADQFCDGEYTLTFTAKHEAFVAYTATYSPTIKVKYDCLVLKNANVISQPNSPQLIIWPEGLQSSETTASSLEFTIGSPFRDVTHAAVTNAYNYSCRIQYAFECPTDTNPTECSSFSAVMTQQNSATPINSDMATAYASRIQLRVPQASNHQAMEVNGLSFRVKAYLFAKDVAAGYYTNGQDFVASFVWSHAIAVTKQCVTSIISVTQKSSDSDAQAGTAVTASATVGQTAAERTKKINLLDLANQWDSKYCLSDFTSVVLKSAQLSNNFSSMFTFAAAVPPNHATIQLIAEANIQVKSPTCTLSTQSQIAAGTSPLSYVSKCSFEFEVEAFIGATSFGTYVSFTFDVLNECQLINPLSSSWQFATPSSSDPIQPIDLSDITGNGKNVYQIVKSNPTTVQWYLPKLVTPPLPSSLIVGSSYPSIKDECGLSQTYSLAADLSGALTISVSGTNAFPVVTIHSSDASKSGQTAEIFYKQVYEIQLKTVFNFFGNANQLIYASSKAALQPQLQFYMQDRCLGAYFTKPQIKFTLLEKGASPVDQSFQLGDSGKKVIYNLKDPQSTFEVERLTPYLYNQEGSKPEKADGKCGAVIYTPFVISGQETLVAWDQNQITTASAEGLKFKIFSKLASSIGTFKLKIEVLPKDMPLKAVTLEVEIEVRKPLLCSLKFDTGVALRTDFKYYQQPYGAKKPDDFENFGSKIAIKLPAIKTDCDSVYQMVEANGENIVSKGCTELSQDFSSLTIDTACLDSCKVGLVTLRVSIKQDTSKAADDIFAAFLTIAKIEEIRNKTENVRQSDPVPAEQLPSPTPLDTPKQATNATSADDILAMLERFKPPVAKQQKAIPKVKLPLKLQIEEVSQTGKVKLAFSRPIDINFDYLLSQQASKRVQRQLNQLRSMSKEDQQLLYSMLEESFKIEYKPLNPESPNFLARFNITEFSNDKVIEIQLNFSEPLYVSESAMSFLPSSFDSLVVTLQDPNVFYDPIFEKPPELSLMQKVNVYIPKQVPADAQKTMEAAVQSAKVVVNAAVPGTIAVNLVLGISLSNLWDSINILKFITHVNEWKLSPPANLQMFFSQADYFASGNFIPKQKIMHFLKLDRGESKATLQDKFFIIIFVILGVVAILAIFILFYCKQTKKCPKCKELFIYIKKEIFWNGIIRSFIQSYDYYSLSMFLLLFVARQEERRLEKKELIKLGLISILIGGLPIFIYVLLWLKRNDLEEKQTKTLFGTLYEKHDTSKWLATIYYVQFCIRRVMFSAMSVFIGRGLDGGVTLIVVYLLHMLQMVYLILVYPHKTRYKFTIEFISELLVQYCFFGVMFCEIESDLRTRFSLGWFSVTWVAICLVLHLYNMGYGGVKEIIYYIKLARKYWQDYRAKKMQAKHQEILDKIRRGKTKENAVVSLDDSPIEPVVRQYNQEKSFMTEVQPNNQQGKSRGAGDLCVIIEDVEGENEYEERKIEESYEEIKSEKRRPMRQISSVTRFNSSCCSYTPTPVDIRPNPKQSFKVAITAKIIEKMQDDEELQITSLQTPQSNKVQEMTEKIAKIKNERELSTQSMNPIITALLEAQNKFQPKGPESERLQSLLNAIKERGSSHVSQSVSDISEYESCSYESELFDDDDKSKKQMTDENELPPNTSRASPTDPLSAKSMSLTEQAQKKTAENWTLVGELSEKPNNTQTVLQQLSQKLKNAKSIRTNEQLLDVLEQRRRTSHQDGSVGWQR